MKLKTVLQTQTQNSLISRLFVNDAFECYILEPANPIPAGVYDILLLHSARFNRIMPFLQSVPGHTGIEIHWGNKPTDTKDCLITGQTVGPDWVGQSIAAFDALFAKLEATSPITIEITREAILPAAIAAPAEGVSMPDPVPTALAPPKSSFQQIDQWFNSPRGHAIGMLVFTVAAQVWPQYAAALQAVGYALGYGAVVAGAPSTSKGLS